MKEGFVKKHFGFIKRHHKIILFFLKYFIPNWNKYFPNGNIVTRAMGLNAKLVPKVINFMEWYKWNLIGDCCGYRREFKHNTIKFLLDVFCPHLKHARKFLHYAKNENGTKLLGTSNLSFSCRTRDEHQYYYRFKCNLFGKITGHVEQYLENGKPINSFLRGMIALSRNEDPEALEEKIETKKELVFNKRILNKRQLMEAMKEVRNLPMEWFELANGKMVEEDK